MYEDGGITRTAKTQKYCFHQMTTTPTTCSVPTAAHDFNIGQTGKVSSHACDKPDMIIIRIIASWQ